MKRILVIGPCGAGKSTVAARLSAILELPVIHLDQLHWKPGWIEGSKEELHAVLEPVLQQDRWLIDGNYGSTMERRLKRADTVIYLDYPIPLCLWRAARRVWQFRGRSRPDMTEGCPERFDLEFFRYILNWNTGPRIRTETLLTGSKEKVLRFASPRQLECWIGNLEDPQ